MNDMTRNFYGQRPYNAPNAYRERPMPEYRVSALPAETPPAAEEAPVEDDFLTLNVPTEASEAYPHVMPTDENLQKIVSQVEPPVEDGFLPVCYRCNTDRKVVAITIDDCFDMTHMAEALDLCEKYGIVVTFFPLGETLKEADRELWLRAIDLGCEIGSHTNRHYDLGKSRATTIIDSCGLFQEKLDKALGFHYKVNSLRPPFGNLKNSSGSIIDARRALMLYGFDHVVNWDVSQTDPAKAIKNVRNGSILLYHTRARDIQCIETLIPQLQEKGFEMVTVSELLEFGPIETSDELYVYNKHDFY